MAEVISLLSHGALKTEYGDFTISVFHDGHEQAVVLSIGELAGGEDVLCRIHSECISSAFFYAKTCDCAQQMRVSQQLIQSVGKGLIVLLEQEGRGWGAAAHVATLDMKLAGLAQPEAYRTAGFPGDIRRYDIVAKIIKYFCVKSVALITSNNYKVSALGSLGVKVTRITDVSDFIVLGDQAENRVAYIKAGTYKPIVDKNKSDRWIFVIGDLNVDYMYSPAKLSPTGVILDKPEPLAGGTAFNAAAAFNKEGFSPIIFGKIGDDADGQFIRHELETRRGIISLVGINGQQHTGSCSVIIAEDTKQRLLLKEENNANDYDLEHLKQALALSQIGLDRQTGRADLAFIVGHPFVRQGVDHTRKLIDMVAETGAKIVLDLVPHNMYETVSLAEFNKAVGSRVSMLIGEYNTLMRMTEHPVIHDEPQSEDLALLFASLRSEFLVLRYGIGNISKQMVCRRISHQTKTLQQETRAERFRQLHPILKDRFGDDELKTLCDSLGVIYDDLGGEGRAAKARELIRWLEDRDRLADLIIISRNERPDIKWPDVRNYEILEPPSDTGYVTLPPDQRRGFGDILTARVLAKYKDVIVGGA